MWNSIRLMRGSGVFIVGALLAHPASAQTLPRDSWQIPFDVGQLRRPPDFRKPVIERQSQIYDFIWQTFIALNWPQLEGGNRAEPDKQANLAPWNDDEQSQGPVVWQTYRRPSEVFVSPSEWPIDWNDPPPSLQALCPPAPEGIEPLLISSYSTDYSDNSDGINQPYIQANYPTGPVADQNGNYLRYEVGLNQSYFSYISYYSYYDAEIQINAVERFIRYVRKFGKAPRASNRPLVRTFQQLPNGTETYLRLTFRLPDYAEQGLVEWKSAWKILDGDDVPQRFYRRYAYFLDPDQTCTGPFKVGLVAFHIHRFTQAGHIGATFEQVDNTRLQPEYSAQEVFDAADLPAHASLNPGGEVSPIYDNGYQVCDSQGMQCASGVGGSIPTPIKDGDPLLSDPPITNVVRQVEIPLDVQESNAIWRDRLRESVLFYYQLIGTQNRNVDVPNPNLGPGTSGAQASNTNNLINTALESYTQAGWSCAQCHQNATPRGVTLPFPPIEQAYERLHTISFLLQNAKRR